jgi:lactose/L-arabinose transport system ATP-binding protein
VRKPLVFLFDEPLSNLDAELRVSMRIEIARLHRELGNTMIYVTHDQTEAMTLADRIVVLRDGRIEQIGTPDEVYDDPNNLFVAGFIGSPRMNIVEARYLPGHEVSFGGGTIRLGVPIAGATENGDVKLGIRPEHLVPTSREHASFSATVDFSENLGSIRFLHCALESGESLTVELRGDVDVASEGSIWLTCDPRHVRLFSPEGERLR